MSIPRLIHQTWKTPELPEPYNRFAETVRACNPEFEYRLWTDADNRRFVKTHYPEFLPRFDSYRHNIERADAIRYFLLYTYGGVYIDLDMENLRPIAPLLKNAEVLLSVEAGPDIGNQVLSNAFMASQPRHPFFREIIRDLSENQCKDITFEDVFNITGPNMVSRIYLQSGQRDKVGIIPLEQICPAGVLDQHPRFTGKSLDQLRNGKQLTLLHHNTESWNQQWPCPETSFDGYTLLRGQDINGFDIDYIEPATNTLETIASKCSANPDAVAFNFNGFIKSPGGRPETVPDDCGWLKPGTGAWICVRSEYLDQLASTE